MAASATGGPKTPRRGAASARDEAERSILQAVAAGGPTGALLTHIAREVQTRAPDWRCSVMVADLAGEHLDMVVAPSFPASFLEGCQGVRIGERGGACGLAALLRRRVVTVDVATDPAWQPFVEWVTSYGVRSAWSTPLVATDGALLGTFALYADTTMEPDDDVIDLVDGLGHLASLVLERDRNNARMDAVVHNLEALVEASPAALIEVDTEGRVALWNPAAERMFGWRADEVIGRSLPIVPSADAEAFRTRTLAALAGHCPPDTETQRVTRSGRLIDVHLATAPVRGDDGEIIGILAILTDITHRKQAQVALQAAFDRERAAAEHLRYLDDAKNAFLSAVSHELRTPLTGVVGFAQTLDRLEGGSPELRAVAMDKLMRNARKLQRMLTDLFDIDRLAQGLLAPDYRSTDLAALVTDVIDTCDALTDRVVHTDLAVVDAEVDPSQVERVVENLLLNAVRHTPRSSPLWVELTTDGEEAHLTVSDAGSGIPESERARVFEPFAQAGSDDVRSSPGVGIGLSLVARFTHLHEGRVWVDERPGGGAAFHVVLPVRARIVVEG